MRSSRDLGASARGTLHHDLQVSIKIFQYPGGFRLRPGLTLASNCCAVAGGGVSACPTVMNITAAMRGASNREDGHAIVQIRRQFAAVRPHVVTASPRPNPPQS